MNQCRQHGTRLPDGTPIGHYWLVTEETTANGSAIFRGECKYCGRVKRFAEHPTAYISETVNRTIRYDDIALGHSINRALRDRPLVKVSRPVMREYAPVRDGTLTGSFSC